MTVLGNVELPVGRPLVVFRRCKCCHLRYLDNLEICPETQKMAKLEKFSTSRCLDIFF